MKKFIVRGLVQINTEVDYEIEVEAKSKKEAMNKVEWYDVEDVIEIHNLLHDFDVIAEEAEEVKEEEND